MISHIEYCTAMGSNTADEAAHGHTDQGVSTIIGARPRTSNSVHLCPSTNYAPHSALMALVKLLARQAAAEFFGSMTLGVNSREVAA